MKKTLKKDITKYDKKMQLRVDMATMKAIGISLAVAVPIFLLLIFTVGMIPAIFVSFTIACGLMLLQVGKVDGISLASYMLKVLRFAFLPKEHKKPYAQDSGEYRISIMTEQELKQKERKTSNGKKGK